MTQGDWRYRRRVNRFNRLIVGLHKIGVRTGPVWILTVAGRRTGQIRDVPVSLVQHAGHRYLFQAYPGAAWVANVRTSHVAVLKQGRRSTQVRLVELSVDERREILRQHIASSPARAGKLLVRTGLVEGSNPDAVAAAAGRIAVFRVESS